MKRLLLCLALPIAIGVLVGWLLECSCPPTGSPAPTPTPSLSHDHDHDHH
jgi:hypothetical protein